MDPLGTCTLTVQTDNLS